jgi:hypothetical protein
MGMRGIEGLPVIDAKRSIMLHITADDIKKADARRPETCAAARACRRELHALEARVHLGRIYVKTTKEKWTRYQTPHALRSEIVAFDRGGTFAPGEYKLAPVTPSHKATGQQKGSTTNQDAANKRRKAKKNYKPRPYHVVTDVRVGPA